MKAYKGFNKDMTCRGFQYAEGETYKTDNAKVCECGFHACKHPLDVFGFYAPNESVYHEVEVGGKIDESDENKVAATEIKIGARLTIAGLVKAAIDFTMSHIKPEAKADDNFGAASATGYKGAASATGYNGAAFATGDKGAASATGNKGAASATGNKGAASATGYKGAASATGYKCAASATGYNGAASATGYNGAASATGNKGAASATGYKGAAFATGDNGAASATGYNGAASATGDNGAASAGNKTAIAVAWGDEGRAKGVVGAHIVVSEWKWKEDKYVLLGAKMAKIDGKKYKADTWYMLKNGKIVEVEE